MEPDRELDTLEDLLEYLTAEGETVVMQKLRQMAETGGFDFERRRIEIHSHQYYAEGWFISWSLKENLLYAIIEFDDGEVKAYEIPSAYSLKFKEDWKNTVKGFDLSGLAMSLAGKGNDEVCTCLETCPWNCKGECGCEVCQVDYADFLSAE